MATIKNQKPMPKLIRKKQTCPNTIMSSVQPHPNPQPWHSFYLTLLLHVNWSGQKKETWKPWVIGLEGRPESQVEFRHFPSDGGGSQRIIQRQGGNLRRDHDLISWRMLAYPENIEIFPTAPWEPGEEKWQEKAGQREEETMEVLNTLYLEWQKVCFPSGSYGHNREKLGLHCLASTRPRKADCQERRIQRSGVQTRAIFPTRTTMWWGHTMPFTHAFHKGSSQIHVNLQRASL